MKIDQILKEQIKAIKPPIEIFGDIDKAVGEFCLNLDKKLKKKKIKAEIFIGGSLAKNTLVKKDKYDVDIFVRFDLKYKDEEISKLLGKVLGKKSRKIHGSRDYYQIIVNDIIIEVVPVMKIKKPEQAQNITDLSYFHVSYVLGKLSKNNKLAKEIILAKTFCYAQGCYGAESYIHGFSGYALELLICHYGSFLNFVKAMSKSKKDKIIIDDSKFYKNKNEILRDLNKSKRQSPIILIDPTFKVIRRNF
jgi:tRNA nucleotidyltransferase (CCA-adding enzyme)